MKRALTLFAAIATLFVASCGGDEYDDTALRQELTDLANRIAKLELLVQQMNTNISSLESIVKAIENQDYITSVAPVIQNGETIGYTITFAKSAPITIYHGTDGKDGYTPQIGVVKDTDGIYYWSLDGTWLTDSAGNKIPAIGQNGFTPQLKIDGDYWYISYDNGDTWTQLGKATGADGVNGDNIFTSVTQDDEYVYFILVDGTKITLPKQTNDSIPFEDLNVKMICCKLWDTNRDGELSYQEAEAVTEIGVIFSKNNDIIAFTELQYFTNVSKMADEAFAECTKLWKIKLPLGVKSIGAKAFKGCTSLQYILLGDRISSIGEYAFYGCENLPYIKLPGMLTSIQRFTFAGCYNLTNVDFNSDLESIGEDAFQNCFNLQDLMLPNSISSIGSGAFSQCRTIATCHLPQSLKTIESGTFSGCANLQDVRIPLGVEGIGSGAFSECVNLKKITIPDSVLTIGDYAFNWSYPEMVVLGTGIQSIGNYAFFSKNIYCKSPVPPVLKARAFDFQSDLKIYVPTQYYRAYTAYDKYDASNNLKDEPLRGNWGHYTQYVVAYDFTE